MSLTDRQLAGNQRRTLRSIRKRLLDMADTWDGVDQFIMTQLTELADKAEEVAIELAGDEPEDAP